MSAFENKTPETIVPTDVDALIGRTENQRLEFKETINDVTSYELAKDLGSFANADGGYIVVGASRIR